MTGNIPKLSRAEEALMLILWSLNKALLKDIVYGYPEPRPSQSTVSTLLRTLERKRFVAHKAYSKTFEYYPLVRKMEYQKVFFNDFLQKYFHGSYEELVRFLAQEIEIELRMPGKEIPAEKPEPVVVIDKKQMSLF